MSPGSDRQFVRFNTTGTSVAGAIAGVIMAIGVPWVVLTHGQVLGTGSQTLLVWVGVVLGGSISFVSAFFGLVMPSQVGSEPWNRPDGHPEASRAERAERGPEP